LLQCVVAVCCSVLMRVARSGVGGGENFELPVAATCVAACYCSVLLQ